MASPIAQALLVGLAAAEGIGALTRFRARREAFISAAKRAKLLGRNLVVVGAPDTGLHTRLLRAYGCGDVCVDIVGCDCPVSVPADITRGPIPGVPDDSSVVFVSCVLEYVSDPFAAWKESRRMAGAAENVFLVAVQPWTLTSNLYPAARWKIHGAPPSAPGLEVSPVGVPTKIASAGLVAGLAYFAFRPTARVTDASRRGSP